MAISEPLTLLDNRPDIPQSGRFLLPVCTDLENLQNTLRALYHFQSQTGQFDPKPLYDIIQAIEYIGRPELSDCFPNYLRDGVYYPPYAAFVEWLPVSPYRTELDQKPFPQMVFPAWSVYNFDLPQIADDFLSWFGTSIETITGMQTGDAYSLVFNMNQSDIVSEITTWLFGGDTNNMLETGFNLHVRGSGVMQVELLSVPLGGRVIYSVDKPVSTLDALQGFFDPGDDIIDTDRDLLSYPPEQDNENLEEITIDSDGDHIVYFRLMPMLNDAIIPIAWGAGLRSIRLGEGLSPIDYETGEPYGDDETGNLKQDLGIIMTTVGEICEGMVCAMEKVAQRILLSSEAGNILNGVEVDPDTGEVTVKTGSNVGTVEIGGAAEELHYGGVWYQALQFKKMFGDMNANITNGYNIDTIVNLTRIFVNPADLLAWDELVTAYETGSARPVIDADKLALKLFCSGVSSGVLDYAISEHSASEDELNAIVNFASGIPNGQWGAWYDKGSRTPRDGYLSSDCYRLPMQELEYTAAMAQSNDYLNSYIEIAQSENRIKRIKVSGTITDDQGNIFDGIYVKDSGGTITVLSNLYFDFSPSGSIQPTEFPPYNPSGGYSFEVVSPSGGDTYLNRLQPMAFAPAAVMRSNVLSGSLTFQIFDVGN